MIRQNRTKPSIGGRPAKKIQSQQQKLNKIQIFFRYRLPSIYRQLKLPIYENLIQPSKVKVNKPNNLVKTQKKSIQQTIEILYKKVMLNSKYHHRQKMRFSRAPLLKYIKYDFKGLQQKLKNKKYMKIYDDLEEDDEEDESKDKKQYELNPQFSQETISRYKKKNQINGRIVIAYGYEDLKQELVKQYGWTENEDRDSLIYDFKYMSKKKDIDYVNLLQSQVVNHFQQNKSVTAKFGLTRNIRNIASMGKDPSNFFPRCFDVNDVSQLQNFFQSYKLTCVESILKMYSQIKEQSQKAIVQKIQEGVKRCIKILQKQSLPIAQKIAMVNQNVQLYISLEQWEFLKAVSKQLKKIIKMQKLQEKINKEQKQNYKKFSAQLQGLALQTCQIASKKDPQWFINRQNIWIVKPASMSRGRGIKTFDDMFEILDYIIGKQISWVAQKYIENPLIIKKRKFDIRQWVLLTDFKPVRIWVYEQCYIRFCAQLYCPEDLKNRKIHLTNNSVTKGISTINDGIEQNMMSQKQFSETLLQMEGKDIFGSIIRPQINKISVETLESVLENIISRKNTLEVFGFDFMVDENYKAWLIEVNSSPTMEHSTKLTSQLVQRGMNDLGSVVNNYMFKNKNYNKPKAKQMYGGWKLLTNT